MPVLSFVLFALWSLQSHGAASYRLNAGANLQVSEHSKCRNLNNSTANDFLVPTNTNAEWTAFLANLPAGVAVTNCCPTGYVLVPGNSDLGVAEFCVMKWEARNSSGNAAATSTGIPWVSITKDNAVSRCSALGAKYSLMTNNQWTTIMRNAEALAVNWSGGARRVGCLWIGNVGVNNNCAYDGATTESGESNTKARYTLSNGEQIWHINGNVSEWVQGTYSTASSASSASNPYLGSRSTGGLTKMSAADRAAWGPQFDDYGSGCGAGDSSPYGNCGVGYYMGTNGQGFVTRGGEANDTRWDGYTMEGLPDNSARNYVGFRCAFVP